MKGTLARIVPLAGRILIGQVFFLAGVNKLAHPATTIALIASHGIPFPGFCCFAAAAVEIVGSLLLVLGLKIRWTALVLAGFVVRSYFNLPLGFHEADQCTPLPEGLSYRGTAARGYISSGTQLRETEARALKEPLLMCFSHPCQL